MTTIYSAETFAERTAPSRNGSTECGQYSRISAATLVHVFRISNGWYYGPKEIDVVPVPDEPGEFEIGEDYNRWELHDVFSGQRYSGIATPADYSIVFIYTGDSGETYGYDDEFLPDGTFMYTGEGAEGDMEMEGGNKAIHEHRQANESLHLFEDTDYPWIVSYVGEFEYADH